jgi:hypothetical protein
MKGHPIGGVEHVEIIPRPFEREIFDVMTSADIQSREKRFDLRDNLRRQLHHHRRFIRSSGSHESSLIVIEESLQLSICRYTCSGKYIQCMVKWSLFFPALSIN